MHENMRITILLIGVLRADTNPSCPIDSQDGMIKITEIIVSDYIIMILSCQTLQTMFELTTMLLLYIQAHANVKTSVKLVTPHVWPAAT